jgi:hypothetical protein
MREKGATSVSTITFFGNKAEGVSMNMQRKRELDFMTCMKVATWHGAAKE